MDDQERELLAFACWTLDKVAKSYLRACWKLRLAMLGELRVDHGVLKCEPSYECVAELKQKQDERRSASRVISPKDLETHWRPWTRGPSRRANKSSRKRGAFYVVWRGRQTGLFYKWSDCMRSVANFAGARFRGYGSWWAAEEAWERGLPDPSSGGS